MSHSKSIVLVSRQLLDMLLAYLGGTRRRFGISLLIIVALILTWNIGFYPSLEYSHRETPPGSSSEITKQSTPTPTGNSPEITKQSTQTPIQTPSLAKVSMLYGRDDPILERALQSHQRHCDRWNHPMHILRQGILSGSWSKPNYLLSIVVQELAKPVEQRQDWLMWVDADSIILNPAIPPTIFLPPTDISDIHFIASKDQNGLNNGIVFLRVHPWTVSMLLETAGNPLFHPEIDLGWSADQTSMANVLAKEEGGFDGTGYKRHGIYMPRIFFNAYQFGHGFEGEKGNILVHLPGMTYTEKWDHMGRWLDILEGEGGREWEVSLEESGYENKTISFWNVVRDVKREIQETESAIGSMAEPMAEPKAAKRDAVNKLKKVLWEEADDVDLMRRRLSELVSLK